LIRDIMASMFSVLFSGALYIGASAGLIEFNKFLMHPGRFPYALGLVLLHTMVASLLTAAFFFVKPSLFPALTDAHRSRTIDNWILMKGVAPISLLFSAQLVLTNTAYLHSSVAFLQMMKEANVVFVYMLSILVAVEKFSWHHVQVLIVVLLATSLTIHGELNFSLIGFTMQGIGQMFEVGRIVLQGVMLTSKGQNLDPMTYVFLVSPLSCISTCCFIGIMHMAHTDSGLALLPPMSAVHEWWAILLANALVAFLLNLSIALFMRRSSPVAFVLAGVVKDCAIVTLSAATMHEKISRLQVVGFTLQMCAVLVWGLMKKFPERFSQGILFGLHSLTDERWSPIKVATPIHTQGEEMYGATVGKSGPSQC